MGEIIRSSDSANPYKVQIGQIRGTPDHNILSRFRVTPPFQPDQLFLDRLRARTALQFDHVASSTDVSLDKAQRATVLQVGPGFADNGEKLPFTEPILEGAAAALLQELGGLASAERFEEVY